MKTIYAISLLILALAGCGYDPESAVYDTLANPDGFPQPALNLINGVEKGQLATYSSITDAFGELYSSQPNLLDNPQWEKIVSRLGIRFRMCADSLASLGVAHYHHASELYTLASFARPNDQNAQERRRLFDAWEAAVKDSVIDAGRFSTAHHEAITEHLSLLKYFLMGDSVQRKFGQDFLVQQLLDMDSVEAALKPSSKTPLSEMDRCFLSVVGLKKYSGSSVLAAFGDPGVELVTAQINRKSQSQYAAELYFIPKEKIMGDCTVALRVYQRDSLGEPLPEPLVLDFRPQPTSTGWINDQVYGAYRRFTCDGMPAKIEVGFSVRREDRIEFLPVRESGRSLFVLPPSTYTQP